MDEYTGPNSVFSGTSADSSWIEIFHSRPFWKVCQISYKKDSAEWVPFGKYRMIDASETKSGFRVFRIRARRFEFRLADGRNTSVDSNCGRNYIIESSGRYVVESGNGCRKVSDACIADCLRANRPNDEWIELSYESNLQWRNCYISYSIQGSDKDEWFEVSMDGSPETGSWFHRIVAKAGIDFVFHNGDRDWDNNQSRNYQIRLPGRYTIKKGWCHYGGVSSIDMHLH